MIKAIFFDIDGTLVPFNKIVPDSTKKALKELKEKGIKIIISSGRAKDLIQEVEEAVDTVFDAYVLLNGQYCYSGDTVYRAISIRPECLKKAYHYLKEQKISCMFAEENQTYVNDNSFEREEMPWSFEEYNLNRADTYPVYQLMATLHVKEEEKEKKIMEALETYKAVRWHDEGCDIIPVDGGKNVGIQATLDFFNITIDETMAFGDGGNDVEMLEMAGIGIAMGNANDYVKSFADYITDKDIDDGIYKALKHFEVI